MTNELWNNMWKIMKDDRLEFDDEIHSEMICIICKKVLINAHSGPCGCRYCLECIKTYLNGELKFCPGNLNDCEDEFINVNINIHLDQPMNRKIAKLIVKCPEKNCDFKDELKNLGGHMRICDLRSVECPYLDMGCKECSLVDAELKDHMVTDIVSHTKMLFELIGTLKNEIKILKEDNADLRIDNEELKKRINDLQIRFENDHRIIKEKIKEIEDRLLERQRNLTESEDEGESMDKGPAE